jgi:hypothetical protein
MDRSEILTAMGDLKLYGMKAAFDEIVATAVKRQHQPHRIIGDLLTAEIAEKQARSIKYQMSIAKLPLAKDIDDFVFDGTPPINQTLVRDLTGGNFLAHQRNVVLVGGTGAGKTHLASAIAPRLHPGRRPGPLLQRRRPRQQARGRGPRRTPGPHRRHLLRKNSSSSTNSAVCRLPSPVASSSSIWSAASMSNPPSSSPPTRPLASGRACLAMPR